MGKKKTRVLWLSKCKAGTKDDWYELWLEEPKLSSLSSKDRRFETSEGFDYIYDFCADIFEKFFPSLKLRKNTKCKLKLTHLKNGIKLEKVKAGKG